MKTLILVRHAKSSWNDPGTDDFDRPLNDRGKKDAPEMAKRLKERGVDVDLIVSSPAKRAYKTAKIFAETLDLKKGDIETKEKLYLGGVNAFEKTVTSLPHKAKVVAIFSHNPGITIFANTLTHVHVDDMPTCAIYAVQAPVKSWNEFLGAEKQFLFFDFPNNNSVGH